MLKMWQSSQSKIIFMIKLRAD